MKFMKMSSKSLLAAVAVAVAGSSVAFAETVVRRIDHPNGPPTFVAVPEEFRAPTIAVYREGQSFADREVVVRSEPGVTDSVGRTMVPIHRGRGEVIYVPIERYP